MRWQHQNRHLAFSDEPEAGSVEISPNLTAELNVKGELIGIEILKVYFRLFAYFPSSRKNKFRHKNKSTLKQVNHDGKAKRLDQI